MKDPDRFTAAQRRWIVRAQKSSPIRYQRANTVIMQRLTDAEIALRAIAGEECSNFTTGPGSCWKYRPDGRDAKYGADRWCDACIALAALTAQAGNAADRDPP